MHLSVQMTGEIFNGSWNIYTVGAEYYSRTELSGGRERNLYISCQLYSNVFFWDAASLTCIL